jgi:hypothetical protein
VFIDVKAVAVEYVDKLIAAGEHYAIKKCIAELPAIPGFDGIGTLPDGALVGFGNPARPTAHSPRRPWWPAMRSPRSPRVSIRRSRPC